MKTHMPCRAFTLIEVLLVLAILSTLAALLMPAVQASRDSVRRIACANNLKQIGLAAALHHDAHGHFPTDGWGYQWIGDPDRGFGQDQPGGWIFNVLPYLEQNQLREMGRASDPTAKRTALTAMTQQPLEVFYCPTRRANRLYPYTETYFPLRNAGVSPMAAKTDYAICAGDDEIPIKAARPAHRPRTFAVTPGRRLRR